MKGMPESQFLKPNNSNQKYSKSQIEMKKYRLLGKNLEFYLTLLFKFLNQIERTNNFQIFVEWSYLFE